MSRIKIDLPEKFLFTTNITVRITDINYGGHAGNDTILSFIHEARQQFFMSFGYKELELGGVGIIMSDVAIEFKSEVFYGEIIKVSVAAGNFSRASFDLFYTLEKTTAEGKNIPVAFAKTGIVTYDYAQKKVAPVPEEVRLKIVG